jgi:hypothetical protein
LRISGPKNLGDAFGVPFLLPLPSLVLFLLCLFLGCHWFYSPFHFFMEKSATNVLLQLFDCIELMKNEVKKKIHAV